MMHRAVLLISLFAACATESTDRTVVVPNDDAASRFSYYELVFGSEAVRITGYVAQGNALREMEASPLDPDASVVARAGACSDCASCATQMTVCYGSGSIDSCAGARFAWKLACGNFD